MKQIPNIFTLLNLFFGCIAIVFTLQTDTISIYVDQQDLSSHYNIPENLTLAAYLIFVAAVIDFLDGFVARLFKASSEMGKQLDSLADVVSFGVAPSVILYQLLRISFIKEENGLNISIIWLLPAFIVACAGAYRLARFNLDNAQSYGFKGVPIPAVGLLIASFPLMLHFGNSIINVNDWITNKWILYGVIILVSGLMISTIPLMALKFKDYTFKNNVSKIFLIAFAILAALILKWLAVPLVFVTYIILSLLYKQK